jgi:alkaline phosphatase
VHGTLHHILLSCPHPDSQSLVEQGQHTLLFLCLSPLFVGPAFSQTTANVGHQLLMAAPTSNVNKIFDGGSNNQQIKTRWHQTSTSAINHQILDIINQRASSNNNAWSSGINNNILSTHQHTSSTSTQHCGIILLLSITVLGP